MKKIFLVYKDDLKKIVTNPFALIITIGIIIIPALYAWFNINSNWDPYSATNGIKIAVVNGDEGMSLEGVNLNIGNEIVSQLAVNDEIGWQFVDEEQAREGVESSEYYAALLIPADFTEDMLSILTTDITRPTITYLSNEKKNAIAPKITNTGISTVQQEINEEFIDTASSAVMTILENAKGDLESNSKTSISDIQTKLDDVISSLNEYKTLISAVSLASDSLRSSLSALSELVPDIDNAASSIKEEAGEIESDVDSAKASAESVSTLLKTSVSSLSSSLDSILDDMQSLSDSLESTTSNTLADVADKASSIQAKVTSMQNAIESLKSSLDTIQNALPVSLSVIDTFEDKLDTIDGKLDKIQSFLNTLIENANKDILPDTSIISQSKSLLDNLNSDAGTLDSLLEDSLLPDLESALEQGKADLSSLDSLSVSGYQNFINASDSMDNALEQSTAALGKTSELLDSAISGIQKLKDEIKSISSSEKVQEALSLLESNPEAVASFLKEPVDVETEAVYPIANYGSGMAPFYTTLAIWVGALVNAAILKTKVKDPEKYGGLTPNQAYFGRYLLFATVSILQGLVICLGDLWILKIQCLNPFLFCLMGVWTAIVYSLLMYTLTISFGDVGKAIAVVLMVIQVAGSGGTYPIEILPEFYQKLYPWFPFNYSINGMRECIGGIYSNAYWMDFFKEGLFIPVILFIGLVLRKPIIRLKEYIEERVDSTGLMG